ncbi:MAG: hypothetical protein CVU13_10225 [Bacteroidetes bacterium HGW-Bacteroidetes-8]|jgi:hypothetical protein|nr:MAG: hypothetical protein CVU13_10225 [Bacteroidetes bacterium HGW-Bacteroidetes-8]
MNDCESVWKRIVSNSEIIELNTITGLRLSYKVDVDNIVWIGKEPTMRTLYRQSRKTICACFDARNRNLSPSQYPGTATSYKWALLNHPKIWFVQSI